MKKIMIAMCLAGALCAFAADEEAAPKPEARRPAMGQRMTPEQMKEFREKMQAEMKARREATQKKIIDALKEAGLDEAKAKETAEKIEKIQMEGRPQMRPGPGGMGMGRGPQGQGMGRGQGRRGQGQGRRQRPEAQ